MAPGILGGMKTRLPALALLLAVTQAAADEPGFTVQLGDRTLGREVLAAGGRSTAELRVVPQGDPFRYEQTTSVDAAGALVRYEMTSNVHSLVAEVTSSAEVRLSGTAAGQTFEKTLPAPPAGEAWLVLDNFVFAHYDLLGRAMLGVTDERALRVLVPQALAAVPGRCRPGAEATLRVGGAERRVRALALTIANVRVEVTVDAETGAAYRVRVPAQKLEAVRDGVAAAEGPPPAPKAPCRELQVTFTSPWGEVPGTLALPAAGEGPWPAVVFLHGSGPNDRDETIGPNKPLRDLAWQLAEQGVASLRYDKRTFLLRTADRARVEAAVKAMTLEQEYLEDGAAALAWLKARDDVRGDALFVAGHSLGGLVAPEVARRGGARGVAVLAGAGRPFDALLVEQLTYQGTLAGKTPAEAEAEARATVAPLTAGLGDDDAFLGGTGRYWKDVLARDPVAELAGLEVPVLLLQGAADCQVRVVDHEALRAGLEARGRRFEARVFPGLNHLFMRVEGPSTGAEYSIPGRVDPEVGAALAGWVRTIAQLR